MIEKAVQESVNGMEKDLIMWRRWLHAHPELAHREHETAAYVTARLEEWGYQPTHPTPTSVVVQTGQKPRMLLRADLDALPITESTRSDGFI